MSDTLNTQRYYERYWSDTGYNPRSECTPSWLQELFERHIKPDDECLDLGCGDGGTAGCYLVDHSKHYLGADISGMAVKLARERGFDAVQIADAAVLPFEDASFDVVVCSEVLEHLFEPQLSVAEVIRVLRPGGRLIVTVPNSAYWRDRVDALLGLWHPGGDDRGRTEPWRSPHIRFFRPATLRRLLLSTGFRHVEVTGIASPLFGRIPLLRRVNKKPGVLARSAATTFPSLLAGRVAAVAVTDPG